MHVNKPNSARLDSVLSCEQTPMFNRRAQKLQGIGPFRECENIPLSASKKSGVDSSAKKVLVENTPTPFLVRKFQKVSTRDAEAEEAYDFFLNKKKTDGLPKRVIPNTPAVHLTGHLSNQTIGLSNNTRRVHFYSFFYFLIIFFS